MHFGIVFFYYSYKNSFLILFKLLLQTGRRSSLPKKSLRITGTILGFYGCASRQAYAGSHSKLEWEPKSPGFLSWTRLIGPVTEPWIHREPRAWQQNREGQAEWGGQEHMVPWFIQMGHPEEQNGQLWRGKVGQTASWGGPHSQQQGIWWWGPWWVKARLWAWEPMLASPGQGSRGAGGSAQLLHW